MLKIKLRFAFVIEQENILYLKKYNGYLEIQINTSQFVNVRVLIITNWSMGRSKYLNTLS